MNIELFAKYGLLGICLFCLGWYVLHLEKQHREEIKEMREDQKQLREEQNEIRREHKEETSRLTECFDSLRDTVRDLVEELRRGRESK